MHPPPNHPQHTHKPLYSLSKHTGILLASLTPKTWSLLNMCCTPVVFIQPFRRPPPFPTGFFQTSHFSHSLECHSFLSTFLLLPSPSSLVSSTRIHVSQFIYTELLRRSKRSGDVPKTDMVKQTAAAVLGKVGKPQLRLSWYACWQAPLQSSRTHTRV